MMMMEKEQTKVYDHVETSSHVVKKNVTSLIIIVMRDLRVFLIGQVEQGFLSIFLKDFDDFSKSGVGYWWRRTVKL